MLHIKFNYQIISIMIPDNIIIDVHYRRIFRSYPLITAIGRNLIHFFDIPAPIRHTSILS